MILSDVFRVPRRRKRCGQIFVGYLVRTDPENVPGSGFRFPIPYSIPPIERTFLIAIA